MIQSPHKTYDTLLPALADLGYDGVELPLKAILFYGKDKFKKLLKATGLKVRSAFMLKKININALHKRSEIAILQVIVMAMTDGPVAPGCGILWGGPYPGFSAPPFPGKLSTKIVKNGYPKVVEPYDVNQLRNQN